MAIGLVTDEEYEREMAGATKRGKEPLSIQQTEQIESHINEPRHGRNPGDKNIPDGLRKLIGEEALLNGRAAAVSLASDLGVSPSSASAYAVGATSTKSYNQPSKTILEYLNSSRLRATKRASRTLNGALNAITQEKLDYADAKDLALIAKNMSAIIKDLEPPQQVESSSARTPQFVIFAPQFRTESSFDVIDVKE